MLQPTLKYTFVKNKAKNKAKNYNILILLTFLCLLFPSSGFSESSFRVFQTQQPAQILIPIIAPLYANQAKITARNNNRIFLKTI